jgi:hypothetical protein
MNRGIGNTDRVTPSRLRQWRGSNSTVLWTVEDLTSDKLNDKRRRRCGPLKIDVRQTERQTPKALANFSPGFELGENPGYTNKYSIEP